MPDRTPDHVTRMLSSASFSLTIDGSKRRQAIWWFVASSFLLLCAGSFFLVSSEASPEVRLSEELKLAHGENQRLQAEVAELKMSLGHERATRETLERELASQAEALKQANKNLGFYRSHAPSGASNGQ